MALPREPLTARTDPHGPAGPSSFSDDFNDWVRPEQPARDWRKLVLVIGLGALSWVATYVGMLELIQSNMGELPFTYKIIIGFSVAMLMTMIIWLLDQLFSPINFTTKVFYVFGYIFLTLISVGFGFGFYWKVLESRSEATRSAESAVGQVQNSLHAGATRLEQLNATLVQLKSISAKKAVEERTKGTSCPNSRPGDGPRRALRDADAQRFAFASEFVGGRIGTVKADLAALDADLTKIAGNSAATIDPKTGTRNAFMKSLGRRLDKTVTGFNAFRTDPQLRQIRSDLDTRAAQSVFPNSKGGTFSCPDAQLQAALRGVVRAIDGLPELSRPEVAAVEGSEATVEAFRRLTASLLGLVLFRMPPTADEMRELQAEAVRTLAAKSASGRGGGGSAAADTYSQPVGLSKRDYIPLAIAIFVDLCLLLVSMGRPLNTYARIKAKMHEAAEGPVYQILSRFYLVFEDEKRQDKRVCPMIEVLHHAIFETSGRYHAAIPLSPAPDTPDRPAREREVRVLTSLFASLEPFGVYRHTPYITAKLLARKKLTAQDSLFADSPDFRIYTFGNNRWPEMILGAVMGAAKRVEADKRRQQALERERVRAASPAQPPFANPTHSNGFELPSGPLPGGGGKAAAKRGMSGAIGAMRSRESTSPQDSANIDAKLKAKFGPHAAAAQRQMEDEKYRASLPSLRGLSHDEARRRRRSPIIDDDSDLEERKVVLERNGAANSNTSASQQHVSDTGGEAGSNGRVVKLSPSLAGYENDRRRSPSSAGQAALPADDLQCVDETTVTLTRETATFTVPTTAAAVPNAILRGTEAAPAVAAPEVLRVEQSPKPAIEEEDGTEFVLEPEPASELLDVEDIEPADEADHEDMVTLAQRLSPSRPSAAE